MNRQQLVDAVGERLGDRKAAATAVEAVLETVSGALADGQKVSIFGFGVFEKVDRAARTARNPATGAAVQVPATSVPRFRPGQALKDAVSGRSSGAAAPSRSTSRTAVAAETAGDGGTGKGASKRDEAGTTKKAKDTKDTKDTKAKETKGKDKAKDTKGKGTKAKSRDKGKGK